MRSGIYQIENRANGKVYIGSAVDVFVRLANHIRWLKGGYHNNVKLQRAWSKYGQGFFSFSVVEAVEDKNDLIAREQFWIDTKGSVSAGYNIAPIAGSNLGMRHSEETKSLMSQRQAGRKKSPEHVEAVRQALLGRKMTPEQCGKMRAAKLGKPRPKHSEETKAKMSAAKRGKKVSEETKAKLSAINTGKRHSPETIEKMRIGRRRQLEALHQSVAA